MDKKFILLNVLLMAFIFPKIAYAAIYKHVDEYGRVTYSNVKIKGGKKIHLEPADTSFGGNQNNKAKSRAYNTEVGPDKFPKVNTEKQKQRDASRKKILLSELASEKQALEAAKKALETGKANPEVHKTANGGVRRNIVKYQEKIKSLEATINAHQRNIELLNNEVNGI